MLNAVQIVLTLLIMMAVGYYLTAKGLITAKVAKFLSQLVLWVGVPASSMDNMLGSFSADMLKGAGMAILAPFVSNLIGFLMAVLVARLIRVKKGRKGIFYLMFAFSNTIFIGLPVSLLPMCTCKSANTSYIVIPPIIYHQFLHVLILFLLFHL